MNRVEKEKENLRVEMSVVTTKEQLKGTDMLKTEYANKPAHKILGMKIGTKRTDYEERISGIENIFTK